jgi:hypothetical protein
MLPQTHRIDPPSNVLQTSVEELSGFYKTMYKMRRMEIAVRKQPLRNACTACPQGQQRLEAR